MFNTYSIFSWNVIAGDKLPLSFLDDLCIFYCFEYIHKKSGGINMYSVDGHQHINHLLYTFSMTIFYLPPPFLILYLSAVRSLQFGKLCFVPQYFHPSLSFYCFIHSSYSVPTNTVPHLVVCLCYLFQELGYNIIL